MHIALKNSSVRSWRVGDEDTIAAPANNREIWLNLRDGFPHPYTQDDAAQWISSVTQRSPETNFAIEVDGEAAGGIGLMLHDDVERLSAEIGYWLGEKFWGLGIMTEALKAVTRYAIKEFGLTRIYAVPFARNDASRKVLEKAGYKLEGIMRRSAIKDGEILDQYLYAVTDLDAARGPDTK